MLLLKFLTKHKYKKIAKTKKNSVDKNILFNNKLLSFSEIKNILSNKL
jgi:hypothetical protein